MRRMTPLGAVLEKVMSQADPAAAAEFQNGQAETKRIPALPVGGWVGPKGWMFKVTPEGILVLDEDLKDRPYVQFQPWEGEWRDHRKLLVFYFQAKGGRTRGELRWSEGGGCAVLLLDCAVNDPLVLWTDLASRLIQSG